MYENAVTKVADTNRNSRHAKRNRKIKSELPNYVAKYIGQSRLEKSIVKIDINEKPTRLVKVD